MVSARHISNVTRCIRCQSRTLSDFLALAGLNRQATITYSRPKSLGGLRRYSPSVPWRIGAADDVAQRKDEEDTVTILEKPEEASHDEKSSIPWYLREQGTSKTPTLPLEREKLPELPPNPPQNLQPILEHLSTDIGLDYLTLLDMRALDPPPPLGSNLIMLIGTARSEKHLHVAAGRFSRWLRKTYKFKVEADGLIGPNELKKRLRRKNKRAKLLHSVQAPEQSNRDDGLSTTWICVNAGFIEKSKAKEQSLNTEGIVGFGTQAEGTRLVVQMFTEEKRQQTDLEALWNSYLTRQDRRDASMAQESNPQTDKESALFIRASSAGGMLKNSQSDGLLLAGHVSSTKSFHTSSQLRGFHSIALRRANAAVQDPQLNTSPAWESMRSPRSASSSKVVGRGSKHATVQSGKVKLIGSTVRDPDSTRRGSEFVSGAWWASNEQRLRTRGVEAFSYDSKSDLQDLEAIVQDSAVTVGVLAATIDRSAAILREPVAKSQTSGFTIRRLASVVQDPAYAAPSQGMPYELFWQQVRQKRREASWRVFELLYRLKSHNHETIKSQLGDGANDLESTDFLRKFYSNVPSPEDTRQWQLYFELLFLGLTVKHPGYGAEHIIRLLEQFAVPLDHFSTGTSYTIIGPAIKHIFNWFFSNESDGSFCSLYRRLVDAVEVLNQKHVKLFSQAMCEDLYLMAIRVHACESEKWEDTSRSESVRYVAKTLQRQGIHPRDSQIDARILEALATVKGWNEYWHYWRGIPQRQQRRPQFLYVLMFQHVAAFGHQRQAIQALEEWIPEMELESPPVDMSHDLARSIMLCLQVADPIVVEHVVKGTNNQGQWVRLWRRCEKYLGSPSEEDVGVPDDLDRIWELFASHQEQGSVKTQPETTPANTPEELLDDL